MGRVEFRDIGCGVFQQIALVAALGAVGLLVSPKPAAAQSGSQREATGPSGLFGGLAIGGGALSISCEGCSAGAGPAASVHLGWMVTDRLGIAYDGSGVGHIGSNLGDGEMSFVFAGAAQYWLRPGLWIKGGLGVARLEVQSGLFGQNESAQTGFGLVAAAGYELARTGVLTVDLQARLSGGVYSDTSVTGVALSLGLGLL